jgi:hypothetical protein
VVQPKSAFTPAPRTPFVKNSPKPERALLEEIRWIFATIGDPLISILITAAAWKRIRNDLMEPFFWYAVIGQFLVFAIGGSWVRRWIRGIAARRYEITVDRSTVKIVQTAGVYVVTRQCNISDVRELRGTAVVSEGESNRGIRLGESLALPTVQLGVSLALP